VIVGGGPVGTRKAMALHDAGANVRVISPTSTPELRSFAGPRFSLEPREYDGPSDLEDADVVIAATGTAVDARVATDARRMHRLVNVASSPGDGSFTSMAVHRSGPLAIGVTTGEVPRAAVKIRDSIASRFDHRYSSAIASCAEIRRSRLAEGGSEAWALTQESLIGDDFCNRIETGSFDKVST
jgi:precorrin-2 dehydrogenase / sirohydrochlorin ferrochelatase